MELRGKHRLGLEIPLTKGIHNENIVIFYNWDTVTSYYKLDPSFHNLYYYLIL